LRQEQHDVHQTDQIHDAFFHAVDLDDLAQARHAIACLLDHQGHVKAVERRMARTHLGGKACKRDRVIFGAPVNQLAVVDAVRGFGSRKVVDGFEQTGLALRVCPMQDDRVVGRQAEFQPGVIAEIVQGQVLDIHAALTGRCPSILPDLARNFQSGDALSAGHTKLKYIRQHRA